MELQKTGLLDSFNFRKTRQDLTKKRATSPGAGPPPFVMSVYQLSVSPTIHAFFHYFQNNILMIHAGRCAQPQIGKSPAVPSLPAWWLNSIEVLILHSALMLNSSWCAGIIIAFGNFFLFRSSSTRSPTFADMFADFHQDLFLVCLALSVWLSSFRPRCY